VSTDPAARDRVLVVDDDNAFGGMIAEVLREKGYDAVSCVSPQEAIDRTRDGSYEAAIIDLVMPEMGGVELAARVRTQSPDTQLLILTGHGDLQSAIGGIQHGILDYLQKAEIDIPRLLRSVGAATQRSRLLRENRQLMEQLSESNRQLTALHEMTTRLSGTGHLDVVLSELIASAKSLCKAAAGRAILFEDRQDKLVVAQAIGEGSDTLLGLRLAPADGIVGRVFGRGTAELSLRPRQDPHFDDRIDELATERPGLIVAPLRHARVRGVLMVAGRASGDFTIGDRDSLAILARHAAVAIDNAAQQERSTNFFTHTSDLLITLLDNRDVHYEGHSRASARLADRITRRLGLSDDERRAIHFGALLHDIGKLLIPEEVLSAKTFTNDAERELLRKHPTLGLELLKPIAAWEEILPMVHGHHERWDGTGYPLGIAGEAIPIGARVIAVAEAFDAMTRRRAHGPARTTEDALRELEAFSGTQFDPRIVRLFVAEYRQSGPE
jgi:putative nucleotidyltransferase with HDIG domain